MVAAVTRSAACSDANACWYRDRPRCGRRLDRIRSGARARHRRRDAEPGGTLARIAEPNIVVIAEATRRASRQSFEFEDLGPRERRALPGRCVVGGVASDPTSLEAFPAGRSMDSNRLRAADHDVPTEVPGAPCVGRSRHVTTLTLNSIGAARHRRHDRDRVTGDSVCRLTFATKFSSAPTAFRCSSRRLQRPCLKRRASRSTADCGFGSVCRRRSACKLACIADGAARPARPRQGGGTDRCGDRAGVFSCAAGRGGAQIGRRA